MSVVHANHASISGDGMGGHGVYLRLLRHSSLVPSIRWFVGRRAASLYLERRPPASYGPHILKRDLLLLEYQGTDF